MEDMINPHNGTCMDPLAVANNLGYTSSIDDVSPFEDGTETDAAWKCGHELAYPDKYK